MYMFLIKILLFLGLISAGYGYWSYSQNKIKSLTENNMKLDILVKESKETIKIMEEISEKNEKLNFELTENLKKAEKHNDELRNTLQKHNLTMLSKKKPGLIERRLNDATKKLFIDITDDTSF